MSTLQNHANFLLRLLPRELRDLIYPDVVSKHQPIPIRDIRPHNIVVPSQSNPTVAAEALEAYYKHNSFILDLERYPHYLGPHPDLAKSQIRHLVVQVTEASVPINMDYKTYETTLASPSQSRSFFKSHTYDRQKWSVLLQFPKLESLCIKMQKRNDKSFMWWDFHPIIASIRDRQPSFKLTFWMSFDDMLKEVWNLPNWRDAGNSVNDYKPMGFVSITHVVSDFEADGGVYGQANAGDIAYVAEYLKEKEMPTNRSVIHGLLDLKPSERRSLGKLYVVQEEALLRVLMEEVYESYKKIHALQEATHNGVDDGIDDWRQNTGPVCSG
ncbi:hypothetical protein B0J11DRAFT_251607 [Dendryphion nanum]|uniref:Uncharacterized protein n=1 Tax=Dendryphion nanum TaxID=256645 RepID=A0A9P9E2W9_9PLEO|nr:hypothetical protein B0J11DRAFT_251607 [Dendryphion nanum]